MPYAKTADLPESVRTALPARAQRIYLGAVNGALATYNGDEEKAHATAWATVKKKFKKQGGKWVAKAQEARTSQLTVQDAASAALHFWQTFWAAGGADADRHLIEVILDQVAEDPSASPERLLKLRELGAPAVEITQRIYDTFGYTGTHEHDFPGSLDHHIRMVCAAVHAQAAEYLGRWGHCVAVYPSYVVTCWSGYDDERSDAIASEYWKIDYAVEGGQITLGGASPVDVLTIVVPQGAVIGDGDVEGSQEATDPAFSAPADANLSAPVSEPPPAEPPVDAAPEASPAGAPNAVPLQTALVIDEAMMERLVAQATEQVREQVRTQFPALYQGTANVDPQWHTDPEWLTQGNEPPGGPEELVQTITVEITQKERDPATGVMKIKGIATRGNALNAMREVYPTQVWQDNLPYLQAAGAEGSLLGESDHPRGSPSLDRTCLMFDEVTMEGDDVLFAGRVLPTIPSGQNIQILLENNARVDISSRGRGTRLKQDWVDPKTGERHQDVMVIQRGFKCRTFDAVVQGASPGATITDHEMAQQANSACEEIDMEQLDALSQQVGQLTALVTQIAQNQAPPPTPPAPAETPAPAPVQQAALDPNVVAALGLLTEIGPVVLERKREQLVKLAQTEHQMPNQWLNAYRTHLERVQATTSADLDRASEQILPTFLAMYEKRPQMVNGVGNRVQQDAGSRPGPKSPHEMVEFMVSEDWAGGQKLPDDDPMGSGFWMKQDAEGNVIHAPDHIRTPRRQCRQILKNIAEHVDGSWNGKAAMQALVHLFQGHSPEAVKDWYYQACVDGATTVGAGGAPSSAIFIFPLVRKVFPQLIVNEIASVQPMDRPDGKIFYLTAYRLAGVNSVDEAGNTITNRMAINRTESLSDSYADDPGECLVSQRIQLRLAGVPVTAETKKLHAEWTIEELQDLRAYHNLDVAAELVSNLSREIAMEWNLTVLNELLLAASAGNLTFGTANATGYSQKEWDEYISRYLSGASNAIFKKRNGGATHIIAGPDAWLKLESSFRTGVQIQGATPEMYPGLLLNPFMGGSANQWKGLMTNFWVGQNSNKILVIRRGQDWSDTPYVWAPYIDYVSPVLTHPDTLKQQQGVMSRAAHKVVVSDAAATVTIAPGQTGVPL